MSGELGDCGQCRRVTDRDNLYLCRCCHRLICGGCWSWQSCPIAGGTGHEPVTDDDIRDGWER